MIIDDATYGAIFEECSAAYFAIGGALMSVITLLYSLALGKKDELFILLDLIKKGNKDPLVLGKRQRLIIHIKSLKQNIASSAILIIYSIIAIIVSLIGRYTHISVIKRLLAIVLILITVFFIVRVSNLLKRIYRQYRKELTF